MSQFSQKISIKFLLIFFILVSFISITTYNTIDKRNKINQEIDNSFLVNSSITFKSDSSSIQESFLDVSGYDYGLYLNGPQQSVCVPAKDGSCSTYGFQFNKNILSIEITDTNGSNIATVPLTPLLERLDILEKENANEPDGPKKYYNHEDMSYSFQNNRIKLKMYFEEISKPRNLNDIENYKALILFSPFQ